MGVMVGEKELVVVVDEGCEGGESSESMVLQTTGAVELGEEVAKENSFKKEVGPRFKSMLTPRLVVTVAQHQGGCVRRRLRARKSFMHGPFGVGASFVVGAKRKHEVVEQCDESESEESESESEQWKRRRGGEEEEEERVVRSVGGKEEEEEETAEELKEMQQLLELQLQAAEKREAGMKQRMETMMDVLSQHMGHMERRVSTLEDGAQPVLDRINVKLEQVMEGFSTLNRNLAILSACLSKDLESP